MIKNLDHTDEDERVRAAVTLGELGQRPPRYLTSCLPHALGPAAQLWVLHVHHTTGQRYYHDALSDDTVWQKPKGLVEGLYSASLWLAPASLPRTHTHAHGAPRRQPPAAIPACCALDVPQGGSF